MAHLTKQGRKNVREYFDKAGAEKKYRQGLQEKLAAEKQHRDKLMSTMTAKVGDRPALSAQEMRQLIGEMTDASGAPVVIDDETKSRLVSEFLDESGQMPSANIAKIAKRSACYLSKAKEVDAIFEAHDSNHDGKLSRKELEMALIRARKDALIRDYGAQDGVGVLATTPVIFDRDLDAIIEKSDWDGDGCIGRDEAAFAIALYLEIQEKRDSACCVIS